jgi:predicted transposase/invertase (TIGR01784 family)
MASLAKQLLTRVELEDTEPLAKADIIELITTIAVYKFANLGRAEVEAMLGITLEETRFYQEVKEEGRSEGRDQGRAEGINQGMEQMLSRTVPILLKTGMSIEQIAEQLEVDVETIRRFAGQG